MGDGEGSEDREYVRRLMSGYRLTIAEVAALAGVSPRSVARLRAFRPGQRAFRPSTLRRVADALGDLTHRDPDEILRDILSATGQESCVKQSDLGIRGAAELARHYQGMNALGRHLLLEHARLLANELPADPSL
jgi:transcriptional regulator with XRE-family HTH domain